MFARAIIRRMAASAAPPSTTSTAVSSGGGSYFREGYFWSKRSNVGPFFVLVFATPFLYRTFKKWYWTGEYRKLNAKEILSDRYIIS